MLFVYYTTTGYASEGDGAGGYNQVQVGYVQTSNTIFPGISLISPTSSDGGSQYDIEYLTMKDGNNDWWIRVNGEWIGRYPKSLFHSSGLQDQADMYQWYGEIYDGNAPSPTSTDLGSGQLPSAGWTHAAYFRNVARFTNNSGSNAFDATGAGNEQDAACYATDTPSTSGDPTWQNWAFFGGPGDEGAGCN